MRDPRREKLRDMRRKARAHGWKIYSIFDKIFPEIKELDRQHWWYFDYQSFHTYRNLREEWVNGIAGGCPVGPSTPPSWFRRQENRLRRRREKASLTKAVQDCELDDFLLPKQVRTIRWDWW